MPLSTTTFDRRRRRDRREFSDRRSGVDRRGDERRRNWIAVPVDQRNGTARRLAARRMIARRMVRERRSLPDRRQRSTVL